MRYFVRTLICALAFAGMAQSASAADAAPPTQNSIFTSPTEVPPPTQGPVYVTTYFEVVPGSAAQAMTALKEYRDAARKEPGVVSSDLLQELGTPSRFATNEVLHDWAAYTAHTKAAARTQLFQKVLPIQFGPPDTRPHFAQAVLPETGSLTPDSVIVLSHLDVVPPELPKLLDIMKMLAEGTAKDAGVNKYEILRQASFPGNHFRLFEVWANEKAFDAHNLAAHTQKFRKELAPWLGTPYDQRRYKVVN